LKVFRKRRGVSEQTATLIIVALVLVAALLLYMIFSSYVLTITGKAQVAVESVELVKSTEGPCVFTCTVKNTGNKPAKAVSVKLANEQPADFPSVSEASPLEPGRTAAIVLTSGSGLMNDYVGGLTYQFTVYAVFLDNSTYATTQTVTCKGGGRPWTPPRHGGGPYLYFGYIGSTKIAKIDASNFKIAKTSEDYGYGYIEVFGWDDSYVYGWFSKTVGESLHTFLFKARVDSLAIAATINVTDYLYNYPSTSPGLGPGQTLEYYDGYVNQAVLTGGTIYVNSGFRYKVTYKGGYFVGGHDGVILKVDANAFQRVDRCLDVVDAAYKDYSWDIYGVGCLAVDQPNQRIYLAIMELDDEQGVTHYGGIIEIAASPSLALTGRHWFASGFVYPWAISYKDGYVYTLGQADGKLYKIAVSTFTYVGSIDIGEPDAKPQIIGDKLFLASCYDNNGKMHFYIARVNLATFMREDVKVDERSWPSGDFTNTPFVLYAEGNYLYCPILRDGGVYIAKIDPANLEADPANKVGPLP
jgi:hypothetical protein